MNNRAEKAKTHTDIHTKQRAPHKAIMQLQSNYIQREERVEETKQRGRKHGLQEGVPEAFKVLGVRK